MNDSEPKNEELLKTQTHMSYARMATEFGIIQVKLLTEKGCETGNINGWYKVSKFKPSQDDELAEKSKTWNYAMRLVPINTMEDEGKSTGGNNGFEIIVLRRTERGQSLGFELPRNGTVHISEATPENDDKKKQEESNIAAGPSRKSRFLKSNEGLINSEEDIEFSNTQETERSDSHLYFLKSNRTHYASRDRVTNLANTNLRSLSLAQPIPHSSVANDIQSTRVSYMTTVQQRDTEEFNADNEKLYRLSLQRKSTIRYSGEKSYSTIFPKTAPVKYNKSALPASELIQYTDDDACSNINPPSKTSSIDKQERLLNGSVEEPHADESLLNPETNGVKHSKKFGLTQSFIDDVGRNSEESVIDYKPKMQYGSKVDMGHGWKEISWEEKKDNNSDSFIDYDGSVLSVKDLQSENELEITVYSPGSDEGKTKSENSSRSNSSENNVQSPGTLRYVAIPKRKIQEYLTKGFGTKQSIVEDNTHKLRQISVKRKI